MSKLLSASDYASIDDVRGAYPSVADIVEVDGGWIIFDTHDDYEVWKSQI